MIRASVSELGLSARAHDKVLRVARTIADLDHQAAIASHHVSEAPLSHARSPPLVVK